jgi:guanosine-3',5'-bis(diphosphate) 3'-pyrophosphohydrolase
LRQRSAVISALSGKPSTSAASCALQDPRCSGDAVEAIDLRLSVVAHQVRRSERIPHPSPDARLVKLADKICNQRDLLARPPADWPEDRKHAYFDWATQVIASVHGTNARLEALFDELCEQRGRNPRATRKPGRNPSAPG